MHRKRPRQREPPGETANPRSYEERLLEDDSSSEISVDESEVNEHEAIRFKFLP